MSSKKNALNTYDCSTQLSTQVMLNITPARGREKGRMSGQVSTALHLSLRNTQDSIYFATTNITYQHCCSYY